MSESTVSGKVVCVGPKGSGKTSFIKFLQNGHIEKTNYFSTMDAEEIELKWASKNLIKLLGIDAKLTAALDTPGTELDFLSFKRRNALFKIKFTLSEWITKEEDKEKVIFLFYFINISVFLRENKCKSLGYILKKKLYERVISLDSSWFEANKEFFLEIEKKINNRLLMEFIVTHEDCAKNKEEIHNILQSNPYITKLYAIFKAINSHPPQYFIGSLKDSQSAKVLVDKIFRTCINKYL